MKFLAARDIPPRATLVIVVLAMLAGIVTGREQPAIPEASQPAASAGATAPAAAVQDLKVDKLIRRRGEQKVEDLFASHSWTPTVQTSAPIAAVPAAPPQPAAPVTPPLPFAYLGRMVRRESTFVYLLNGEDMLLVESGQAIGEYRVEAIGDSAMTFSYAPTGAKQTLSFPGRE